MAAPPGLDADGLLQGARQLFSTDYYFKQWGRLECAADLDKSTTSDSIPRIRSTATALARLIYERYFRVRLRERLTHPYAGRGPAGVRPYGCAAVGWGDPHARVTDTRYRGGLACAR